MEAKISRPLRVRWAQVQNAALERAGVAARVDHRTLEAQGIEREAGQHRGPAISGIEARGEEAQVAVRREAERLERVQARAAVEAEVRVVTREELAAERVAVRERRELAREVTGEQRAVVLPWVEADRPEQLGRAQAASERRVERRQGSTRLGGELKDKLVAQARALRERIGREVGRVREWVRERFPNPFEQLKERTREVFGAVLEKARSAVHARADQGEPTKDAVESGAAQKPKPTLEEIRAAAREAWGQYRERALENGAAQTLEEVRRQAREDWGKLHAEKTQEQVPVPTAERSLGLGMEFEPDAPGTPLKPSSPAESEQSMAEGRATNTHTEVLQALERERLQAREREAQLKKQRAALERWRARDRGSAPDPLKERSGEGFEGTLEKARGPERQGSAATPEKEPERAQASPPKRRGMFDGLRLRADRLPAPSAERDLVSQGRFSGSPQQPIPGPVRDRQAEALTQAVDRYARAWMDAWRMRERDLPILEHQKTASKCAREELDQHWPGVRQDLNTALRHEPQVRRALMELEGAPRVQALLAGIEHEGRVRRDPHLRAARLVKEWEGLEARAKELTGWQNEAARDQARGQMRELALEFKQEPQLELAVKRRAQELGMEPGSRLARVLEERNLERALSIAERDLGRSRGMSL